MTGIITGSLETKVAELRISRFEITETTTGAFGFPLAGITGVAKTGSTGISADETESSEAAMTKKMDWRWQEPLSDWIPWTEQT